MRGNPNNNYWKENQKIIKSYAKYYEDEELQKKLQYQGIGHARNKSNEMDFFAIDTMSKGSEAPCGLDGKSMSVPPHKGPNYMKSKLPK